MKKLLSLLLILAMCLAVFSGCKQSDAEPGDTGGSSVSSGVDGGTTPKIKPIVPKGNDGRYGIFDRKYSGSAGPAETGETTLDLTKGAMRQEALPGYKWFDSNPMAEDTMFSTMYGTLGAFAEDGRTEFESQANQYFDTIESMLKRDYELVFSNQPGFSRSGFSNDPYGMNQTGVALTYGENRGDESHMYTLFVRAEDGWQQASYAYACVWDEDAFNRLDDMDASSMLELAGSLTGIQITTGDLRALLEELIQVREATGTGVTTYTVDAANTETMDTVSIIMSQESEGWRVAFAFNRNLFAN